MTFSVMKELKRRNALKSAMAGRNEKSLSNLMTFLNRYLNDSRFSEFLIGVANDLLGELHFSFFKMFQHAKIKLFTDLYSDELGTNSKVDRMFIDLKKKVDREVRNLQSLMMLQGVVNLVLSASKVHEEPALRSEEIILKERMEKSSMKLNQSIDRVLKL